MELAKTNNENSFDPTPKLKSSPVPILFISFNNNDYKCNYCGLEFSKTIYRNQKYCKNCLTLYTKYLTDNNKYLDVRINTNNSQCSEHEPRSSDFLTQNIQEWCVVCSEVLYFEQILVNHWILFRCKLCGKSTGSKEICSNCYLISSGWIESTSFKKLILCLPWWDAHDRCRACNRGLKIITDYQKWCSKCFIIYI